MSSAQNVSTWFWEEFGTEVEWLTHSKLKLIRRFLRLGERKVNEFFPLVSDTPDAPWVHSVSYSFGNEVDIPQSYWDRLNAEFIKAGVRGISLMFGSGDSGTGKKTNPH